MFKNSKEKEINYIDGEEVEKLYELQRKSFEAKISEQQKKIDELTDYISVRFGENVAKSNIATKLNNIESDLKDIQDNHKTYLEKTKKELTKQIKKENEKIATELNDIQTESYFKLLQKNEKDLEKVQNTITENKENGKKILELDETVKAHIKNYEEYKEDVQKELNETKKKIDKVNYTGITSKFDKKIKEECSKLKNKLEEANGQIRTDVIKQSEDIANLVGNLDERLSTEIILINEQLGETINQTGSKNQELTKKVTSTNKKIDDVSQNLSELETKLEENINKIKTELEENTGELKTEIANNSNEFKTSLEKNVSEIKTEFAGNINEMKTEFDENVSKLEKELKTNTKKISTNNETTKKVVANLERRTTKIIDDLDEKIENYKNDEKAEIENISLVVDTVKNAMDENYENIEQKLLVFKEEITACVEQHKNNTVDVELLKKDYNKLVAKMNSELAKISKSIMSAQKKNLETNQNLQAKIKTYVDNKIEKINNIQKAEELINNLDISIQQRENEQRLEMEKIISNLEFAIQEREKSQKLEIEELLNKKLKAIQKENERLLNKKIEELSSKFVRKNAVQENTNPNKVTFYTEQPKSKKSVYELIDEEQILKKTAKSKKDLLDNQGNKSQILKFFYD